MFAGKTAINSSIIPIAAYDVSIGIHNPTAKITSLPPLILFNSFGFGKKSGMILIYILGFLKWFNPASK